MKLSFVLLAIFTASVYATPAVKPDSNVAVNDSEPPTFDSPDFDPTGTPGSRTASAFTALRGAKPDDSGFGTGQEYIRVDRR